jgi:hypothetical protein
MKWIKALTAEEAALVAVGLENHESLIGTRLWGKIQFETSTVFNSNSINTTIRDMENTLGEMSADSEGMWPGNSQEEGDRQLLGTLINGYKEARDIYNALLVDIFDEWCRQEFGRGIGSCLVLVSAPTTYSTGDKTERYVLDALNYGYDEPEDYSDLITERCTVTKASLVTWFRNFNEPEKAELFDVMAKQSTGSRVSSKSKNSYLRTIQVLADALLDRGLSGNDSGDSRLILSKLAQKGKEAPLKERTLSNYLKEARELP